MALIQEFEAQGEALFRGRSYLPVLFAAPFLLALRESEWLELAYGDLVDDLFDWSCVGISLLGVAVRVYTAGTVPRRTSGRNTKKGQVADQLNTSGAYSVVRHPLYVGNFLMFFGLCLTPAVWWLALLSAVLFALFYERIMFAEERFLRERFGASFERWSDEVPAFVPNLRRFRPADLPFCWRTAVKREYLSVLALATCFLVVDYVEDLAALGQGGLEFELETTALFAVTLGACSVIRYLRKRTSYLSVAGR